MRDRPESEIARTLRRCAEGLLPANVALMQLHIGCSDARAVSAAIDDAVRRAGAREERNRLSELAALGRSKPDVAALVASIMDASGIVDIEERFDRIARTQADSGSALYALGDPELLDRATQEVVELVARRGLLGPAVTVAEVGCGSGRFLAALAPRVGRTIGIDISAEMLGKAAERCAGKSNVLLCRTSGDGLSVIADEALDLVLYLDCFPYLVEVGRDLARRHVEEAARVLKPRGRMVVVNYSYGGDADLDRATLGRNATAAGLSLLEAGGRPFRYWDGTVFDLIKR